MVRRAVSLLSVGLLGLSLAACQSGRSDRTFAEMNAAEAAAARGEVEEACRARGIGKGSRAHGECVRIEAVRRGYTRYDRR